MKATLRLDPMEATTVLFQLQIGCRSADSQPGWTHLTLGVNFSEQIARRRQVWATEASRLPTGCRVVATPPGWIQLFRLVAPLLHLQVQRIKRNLEQAQGKALLLPQLGWFGSREARSTLANQLRSASNWIRK